MLYPDLEAAAASDVGEEQRSPPYLRSSKYWIMCTTSLSSLEVGIITTCGMLCRMPPPDATSTRASEQSGGSATAVVESTTSLPMDSISAVGARCGWGVGPRPWRSGVGSAHPTEEVELQVSSRVPC